MGRQALAGGLGPVWQFAAVKRGQGDGLGRMTLKRPDLQLRNPILPPLHHLEAEPVKGKGLALVRDRLSLVDHQAGHGICLVIGQVPVHCAVQIADGHRPVDKVIALPIRL